MSFLQLEWRSDTMDLLAKLAKYAKYPEYGKLLYGDFVLHGPRSAIGGLSKVGSFIYL
jgi:hypothetical protein